MDHESTQAPDTGQECQACQTCVSTHPITHTCCGCAGGCAHAAASAAACCAAEAPPGSCTGCLPAGALAVIPPPPPPPPPLLGPTQAGSPVHPGDNPAPPLQPAAAAAAAAGSPPRGGPTSTAGGCASSSSCSGAGLPVAIAASSENAAVVTAGMGIRGSAALLPACAKPGPPSPRRACLAACRARASRRKLTHTLRPHVSGMHVTGNLACPQLSAQHCKPSS